MTILPTLLGDDRQAFRSAVLRAQGANDAECAELLAYNENVFATGGAAVAKLPLPDEPFVADWARYAATAARRSVWPTLRDVLVQLRFPIAPGISRSERYRDVTLRGALPPKQEDSGLKLRRPEELRLVIHPTPAGRIPALIVGDRTDFVTLVQALTRRNEPEPIPVSMGACLVSGYNNWERVARLKHRWGIQQLAARKELYQDRFIILTTGPYSGVPAECLGLDREAWRQASLTIRLEHECAHYFTRRIFGSMKNVLWDELIADYVGIVAATGSFRADWILHFLGLESFPRYRDGGRLQNYRGNPPLSGRAFEILRRLVKHAADSLEIFDNARAGRGEELARRTTMLMALARLTLEEIGSTEAYDRLEQAVTAVQSELRARAGERDGFSAA